MNAVPLPVFIASDRYRYPGRNVHPVPDPGPVQGTFVRVQGYRKHKNKGVFTPRKEQKMAKHRNRMKIIHTGTLEGDYAAAVISRALARYRTGQRLVLMHPQGCPEGERLMKLSSDFFHSRLFHELAGLLTCSALDKLTRMAVRSAARLMKDFAEFRYDAGDLMDRYPDQDAPWEVH